MIEVLLFLLLMTLQVWVAFELGFRVGRGMEREKHNENDDA